MRLSKELLRFMKKRDDYFSSTSKREDRRRGGKIRKSGPRRVLRSSIFEGRDGLSIRAKS